MIFSAVKCFDDWRRHNSDTLTNGTSPADVTYKAHVITSNVEHDSIAKVLKHLESEGRIGQKDLYQRFKMFTDTCIFSNYLHFLQMLHTSL